MYAYFDQLFIQFQGWAIVYIGVLLAESFYLVKVLLLLIDALTDRIIKRKRKKQESP